jgi:hypothetical protein
MQAATALHCDEFVRLRSLSSVLEVSQKVVTGFELLTPLSA